jgi:hypothetical protein
LTIFSIGRAIFDRHVPAFDVARFIEAAAERDQHRYIGFR